MSLTVGQFARHYANGNAAAGTGDGNAIIDSEGSHRLIDANRPTMKTKSKPPPPRDKTPARPPVAADSRPTQDQRWQRTVRFNWDKGGSKGGRK